MMGKELSGGDISDNQGVDLTFGYWGDSILYQLYLSPVEFSVPFGLSLWKKGSPAAFVLLSFSIMDEY